MNATIHAFGLSLLVAGTAAAQTVTTVVNNGPSSQLIDIVILAEGYRASEEAQFDLDVQTVVNHFRDDADTFPYDGYYRWRQFPLGVPRQQPIGSRPA